MSLLTGIMVPRTPSRARRMEKDCCEVRSGGIVPGTGLVPLTAVPKPPSRTFDIVTGVFGELRLQEAPHLQGV